MISSLHEYQVSAEWKRHDDAMRGWVEILRIAGSTRHQNDEPNLSPYFDF